MSQEENLKKYAKLLERAMSAVENSINRCTLLSNDSILTLDEFEKYDALTARFSRATEVCLKYFKAYEIVFFAESSENLRTLIGRMEKNQLVSNTKIWLDMRLVRNKVAHDYITDSLVELYNIIISDYAPELRKTYKKIMQYASEIEKD